MTAAKIKKISLTNFRNYVSLDVDSNSSCIVLTGINGAGKTNILEAVSFLSPGRGLRKSKLKDIDCKDNNPSVPWAVFSEMNIGNRQIKIGTGREAKKGPSSSDTRIVKIDHLKIDQADLANYYNIFWVTPEMDRLFNSGRTERRAFLDKIISQFDTNHSQRLTIYEKSMRQRMVLLNQYKKDEDWILVLERQMVEQGIAIAASRREMVDHLNSLSEHETIFPKIRLTLKGFLEDHLNDKPSIEVETLFLERLKEARTKDVETKLTHYGPHRSDFIALNLEKNISAEFCSMGEQKMLLLSVILSLLKLSEYIKNIKPIILFDDIIAHLDQGHRMALFHAVDKLGGQAWYSGTDPSFFDYLKGKAIFYNVENSKLSINS